MRLRATLLGVIAFGFFALVPLSVYAAGTSFFGPIFPAVCSCPGKAPDWGCVLQTLQNVIEFAVSFGVLVSILFIAYAGFLWMMSPFHSANRQKGRTILLNAFIGLAIILAGWLIVDFVLKNLYNANASGSGVAELGPWNEILAGNSGSLCVDEREYSDLFNLGEGQGSGSGSSGSGGVTSGSGGAPDPSANGNLRFQSGVNSQLNHASAPLQKFLQCMAGRIPSNTGYISGISDSDLLDGDHTLAECRAGQCHHCGSGPPKQCSGGGISCHYGGRSCQNSQNFSYAVDYGDGGDDNSAVSQVLEMHARACAASEFGSESKVFVNREGNHVHFSVGQVDNCNCN